MIEPIRGDVWLVDLGYAAKIRPCLILSIPASDEDRALVTVITHTTSVRGSRFEVIVQARFLKSGAFNAQDLQSVPHVKLLRKLGQVTAEQLQDIEDAVCEWLGL